MKTLSRFISAAALIAGTSFAQAALITEWTYSTNATFTAATFEATGTGTTTHTASELSWGATGGDYTAGDTGDSGDNRSALTIGTGETGDTRFGGGPVSGSVVTDLNLVFVMSEIGLGVTFTHWNNPIDAAFRTLLGGTVFDTLTLTPLVPPGGPSVDAPELTFNFEFRETPNAGPCAGGTDTPCGDLFGFAGTPNLNLAFSYDGIDYFASILILGPDFSTSPIAFLNDGQCAALGFTDGPSGQRCQGFLTEEDATTTVRFAFVITTSPITIVPEPASVALFGLGLLALGFARRSRSRA